MPKKIIRSILLVAVLVLGFFAARETLESLQPPPPPPQYRVLVLGDDTTVPMATSPAERWPQQMLNIFREENHLVEDPHILAETGMGVERLVEAVARPGFKGPYDLVLLQIGADDIGANVDPENYRVKFANLLIKAIARAGNDPSRVIVLSIPDWTAIKEKKLTNRAAIKNKIDRFNEINLEESSNAGVRYVNITSISRRAAFDISFLSDNRQDPSGRMYEIWARKIYPVALTALGE